MDTSLPRYLKPLPSGLPESDVEYLRSKGVLSSPSPSIQMELWDIYFRVIHPSFPILDVEQILQSINPEKDGQISLLLFHCINLVARLFLDLHETYYRKRESLRFMFEKARVLYDFNLETDKVVLLQSALLMTFYPHPLNSPKGSAHWLAQAVSIAYTIDLHRDPMDGVLTARQKSVRKQLWWSLYIRERTIVLDIGLPWMIDENDYDIPMITNNDFCLAPLIYNNETSEQAPDLEKWTQGTRLGQLFLQKAKLATVCSNFRPLSVTSYEWDNHSMKTQSPRVQRRTPNLEDLDAIDGKLDQWWTEIQLEIDNNKWFGSEIEGIDGQDFDLLQFHYDGLLLTYRIAVHHISCLRWLQSTNISLATTKAVIKDLKSATWTIIHLVQDLSHRNVKCHLELLGPSAIRPLLLYVVLSQRLSSPFLTSMEANRIHSFLLEVGEGDPFFSQAYSYVGCGADTIESPSPARFNDLVTSVSQSEPQARQIANIFDGILGDLNMDLDSFVSELSCISHMFHSHDLTAVDCVKGSVSPRLQWMVKEVEETETVNPSEM